MNRLFCDTYNPHRNNIGDHLDSLSKNLALYSSVFDNYVVIGDFNIDVVTKIITKSFCDCLDLTSLIKELTRYPYRLSRQDPDRLSCIDLILTKLPLSLQSSCVVETGLSDTYQMILKITKMTFQELKPRVINYNTDEHFHDERSTEDWVSEISNSYLEFDN